MPITFTVDHDRMRVAAEAVGPITFDDIRRHLVGKRDERAIPYRELMDAREATAAFSAGEAHQLAHIAGYLTKQNGFGHVAVLVTDTAMYGMLRMLQTLTQNFCKLRPFWAEERERAEHWLYHLDS